MTDPLHRRVAVLVLAVACCAVAQDEAGQALDRDGDSIPDTVEVRLGLDPAHREALELIHEDGLAGAGDKTCGRELQPYGDFTAISFCPVARRRYLWKIDFAADLPWPAPSYDVVILYLDADNNPETGRPDAGPGTDAMVQPVSGTRLIDWDRPVATTGYAHGRSLYLVADMDLNQSDGESVFRMTFLYQDMREEHRQNRDNMAWITVRAAGQSERQPVRVPEQHPLYRPPEEISYVAARPLFGEDGVRVEVTFITSWTAKVRVEYGATAAYGQEAVAAEQRNNHRVFLGGLTEAQTIHYRVVGSGMEGDVVGSDHTCEVRRPPSPSGREGVHSVELRVSNEHGQPLSACPLTMGLPFAPGVLADDAHLRLEDIDGNALALQSSVTARWADGSVKWVLLDFAADVPAAGGPAYRLRYGNAVRRAASAAGISVDEGQDQVVVDTGCLRAVFEPLGGGLFRSIHYDRNGDGRYTDDEVVSVQDTSAGARLVDGEGNVLVARAVASRIEVECRGPLRTAIRVQGTHVSAGGQSMFGYIARYHFSGGSPLIRLDYTVGNDQTDSVLTTVKEYAVSVPLTLSADSARVSCAVDGAAAVTFGAAQGDLQLTQQLDSRWVLESPLGTRTGQRGPDALHVSDGTSGVWVGLSRFWEMYPTQLAFRSAAMGIDIGLLPAFPPERYRDLGDAVESDRLYYHLRDGAYRLHRGVSFTRTVWLGFHGADDRGVEQWRARLRLAPVVHATPEWYCGTGVFGEQLPRMEGRFTHYEDMVERGLRELLRRREANRSYGFLNFGDWWGERGYNWGNIEYDTQHLQMMQFARTGDRRFFDNACAAAVHNRDVDFVHYDRRPGNVGKTRAHCMFHTGGYEPRMTAEQRGLAGPRGSLTGPLSGHQWTRGLFEHYFMTGDRRSLETAMALSDVMAGPHTVNWTMGKGAERAAAWAIFAVLAAYEVTYDPYYLNAARIQIEDVVRKQDPEKGHWHIPAGYSKVEPKPIGGYAWCTGLLITALEWYNRYAQDPRVNTTILRAANWLVRDEYVPAKQGFRSCSCPTFDEKTRSGGSCWAVSNALAHAYELSGEERFLDLAQMGFAFYARGGTGMGKSYSIALVTSPYLLAKLHRAGRDDLDPARWERPLDVVAPTVLPPGSTSVPLLLRTRRKESIAVAVAGQGGVATRIELHPDSGWQTLLVPTAQVGDMMLVVTAAGMSERVSTRVLAESSGDEVGERLGLVAGEEDFLGPALQELGVELVQVKDVAQFRDMAVMFFGTQACTLNVCGTRTNPEPLLRWLTAGGTAVFVQPNDGGWDPFLVGVPLILQEEDSVSGSIVAAEHPLLCAPHPIQDLAGAKMFDSVGFADERWTVLLRDENGRPAVLETGVGQGRAVVMVPSFDRYVTGQLAAPSEAFRESCRQFLRNVVAYARGP